MRTPSLWRRLTTRGRLFIWFWLAVVAVAAILGATLHFIRPPHPSIAQWNADVARHHLKGDHTDILPPQMALLEKHNGTGGFPLPLTGPHGQTARQIYAAQTVDVPPGTPMVAVLLEGISQPDEQSTDAMASLPGAVSVAFSPYLSGADTLMETARQYQHETLLVLPMQASKDKPTTTQTPPADDAGPRAIRLLNSAQQNTDNLNWVLSRMAGYVGVVGAPVGPNANTLLHSQDFTTILGTLDKRGLLYVNGTVDQPITGAGLLGQADVQINADTDIVGIDIQLLKLQQAARRNGHAIGVMSPLRPVALACLRAWIAHLKDVGIALVPVSQLILPPDPADVTPTTPNGAMRVNLAAPQATQSR
ncbi:MAG: divergent polysaccharide deacetylase family protein [Acetobacter papayae]